MPIAVSGVVTQVIAAASPVVVHVSTHLSTWENVAAIFTAVGGIGAAVSAFFSWRSASRSEATARDARDALAASLKPQMHLVFNQYRQPGHAEVRAVVVAPLSPGGLAAVAPATDVRLEFSLASGGHGSASLAVLEPRGSDWAVDEPYLALVIREPDAEWPPEGGDRVTATVTYSDVRGAATYRLSRRCDLWPSGEPGVVSFRDLSEPTETRVAR